MRLLLAALATTSAVAFTVPTTSTVTSQSTRLSAFEFDDDNNNISAQIYDPLNLSNDESSTTISNNNKAAAITTALLTAATPLAASANDSPNWGIFEGRTGSLLHPAAMGSMALFSLSTALLGFQWRRQRTLGEEISSLKKQLPNLNGAASVSAAIATAEGAESVDTNYVNTLRGSLSIESQINELSKERKELASAGPKDKHFSQGSLLLFIGTAFAIEGPLNTYARAGKLFPGPHLYAGAGLVVLWALAASMVPAMQKGNDAARTVHIGANVAGIGLFVWQVTSGVPILFKVLEFTKWP